MSLNNCESLESLDINKSDIYNLSSNSLTFHDRQIYKSDYHCHCQTSLENNIYHTPLQRKNILLKNYKTKVKEYTKEDLKQKQKIEQLENEIVRLKNKLDIICPNYTKLEDTHLLFKELTAKQNIINNLLISFKNDITCLNNYEKYIKGLYNSQYLKYNNSMKMKDTQPVFLKLRSNTTLLPSNIARLKKNPMLPYYHNPASSLCDSKSTESNDTLALNPVSNDLGHIKDYNNNPIESKYCTTVKNSYFLGNGPCKVSKSLQPHYSSNIEYPYQNSQSLMVDPKSSFCSHLSNLATKTNSLIISVSDLNDLTLQTLDERCLTLEIMSDRNIEIETKLKFLKDVIFHLLTTASHNENHSHNHCNSSNPVTSENGINSDIPKDSIHKNNGTLKTNVKDAHINALAAILGYDKAQVAKIKQNFL